MPLSLSEAHPGKLPQVSLGVGRGDLTASWETLRLFVGRSRAKGKTLGLARGLPQHLNALGCSSWIKSFHVAGCPQADDGQTRSAVASFSQKCSKNTTDRAPDVVSTDTAI